MKKIKTLCKKAVAVIEVAAMTLALVGGLSLGSAADVSAAEGGTLELNAGTKIVSDGGDVFSFTAPEDGTYYFYSISDEDDPMGTLTTATDEIEMDDYENEDAGIWSYDFKFVVEMSKDEECQLKVDFYDAEEGDEYETTVYVCDEETAQLTPWIMVDGGDLNVNVGEGTDLSVTVLSIAETEIEELPEEYSVKWFSEYYIYDEETEEDIKYTNDLETTGTTYSIDEVTEEDLCTEETDYLRYTAVLYNGEEKIGTESFYLADAGELTFYGNSEYVNVGDEMTFTPEAYDVDSNNVDLSEKENYSFVWYKATENEDGDLENYQEIEGATEYSYTFEVTEEDFCNTANENLVYVCQIYEDEEYCDEVVFRVYDKAKVFYLYGDTKYAKVGEEVTFEPEVCDYDDEIVDITGKDNISFKWYKIEEYTDGEGTEKKELTGATGNSYTLKVTASDFYEEDADLDFYYRCEIYVDGEYADYATFKIYNADTYFEVDGDQYYINEGDDITLTPVIYDAYDNEMDINNKDFTFQWYSYNYDTDEELELGNEPTLTIKNYSFASELEYYVCITYKGKTEWAEFYIDNGYTSFIGGYDEHPADLGDSVTLTPVIYSRADSSKAEFDDSFTFEWYKVTYDEEDETVYGDVLGTELNYEIESVTEDDWYGEDSNYAGYACKIYRDGMFVTTYHVDIMDASTYWAVDGEKLQASVGDKVTLKPIVTDGYGKTIDIDNERYEVTWYDYNEDEIGTGITHTIDSVTADDFFDKVNYRYYTASIYDTETDEYKEAYFHLYEKEDDGEEPTTEPPTIEPPTPEVPTTGNTTTGDPTTGEQTTGEPATKAPEVTTTAPKTDKVKAPAKAKIKKIKAKKKSAKKVKVTLKKIKSAAGYQVAVYKTKKNAKKNKKALVKKFTKKVKITLKSKKLKNKKKLFVKARAYVLDANNKKVYGKWSKIKKVKVK